MNQETMTVHKALAEKKLLESRIAKAIAENIGCVANKHSNEKISGIPLDEYKELIQSRFDKASDLIKRQRALNKAIVLSNAVTKVKIGDTEYTVAEAIWMKNHGIEHERMLMEEMRNRYSMSQAEINRRNEGIEERAEQFVTGIYNNKEGKVATADIEKVKKDFIISNQYELVNPLNILEKIEEYEKRINDFMAEVDSALSVSNALTEITIEY